MRCLSCSLVRPYRRTRMTIAARRSSWTGLRSKLVRSSRLRPAWRRATTRTAGTRTPRKTSPSPYPPGPVLKYRWSSGTRSGSAASRSLRRSSFRSAGGEVPPVFPGPIRRGGGSWSCSFWARLDALSLTICLFDQSSQFLDRRHGGPPPMCHPVAVRAQRNKVFGRVHLSLVLREWSDVMYLDVAIRVVSSVNLVEVEAADLTHRAVNLYRHLSVLPASLVRDVLDDPLAAFAIRYHLLIDYPVSDGVYLQGALGHLFTPVGR